MPNTYSKIYLQIVFAVKGRENLVAESIRVELQKYITGIVSNRNEKVLAVSCIQSISENYALVTGSHGRLMYWEYTGGNANLMSKMHLAGLMVEVLKNMRNGL
ncbi:hypothetical protein NF867_06495 [Solitalea sp. MAHUQ-68]|uniref:Uncharacterized protein n=1 Tax=Solitalea agri TaxID=2953739 RepID=A0A9X2F5Y6_9SPHI|nr:hypothetical protein [Solitalea agri]MCO4292503.1 hypothetical protein [Solitalea agri]